MSDSLRLSEVLARGVPIEWFEAVALVLDVSDHVRETLGGQSMPELHQIELASEGTVSLSGAGRTNEPVRRLGQLLQAALVHSDPPVQLRLTVSQATAPAPAFGSIRDFSEALAYFERPGRAAVLRALFERAAAAPAAGAELTPALDVIAPLEQLQEKQGIRLGSEERSPKRRVVSAVAATVMLVVGGTAYWQFAGFAPSNAHVSALAIKASDAVGTTLVSGLSAVSDKVGLGRLVSSDAPGSVPPVPSVVNAPPKPAVVQKRADDRPSDVLRVFDLSPQVAAGLPTPALSPASIQLLAVPELKAPPPDSHVYSASDPEVEAPIGVRPQLPAVLPTGVSQSQLAQIELLVLPDGTVGSVKLLGPHRTVLAGMLLSAAKAWQFVPAMKDGRPVAYRKLVWLLQ